MLRRARPEIEILASFCDDSPPIAFTVIVEPQSRMPSDHTDKTGVRKHLLNAESQFSKAERILQDRNENDVAKTDVKNYKKSSSMSAPQSFSPAKEAPLSINRKLEFGADTKPAPPRRTGYNVISFLMMLVVLLGVVLFHGTCYIPFQPANDAICPLVERVKVSSAPVTDAVVSTITDATHSLVVLEHDIVAKFEGQVARLQNSYPWMWRRSPTGKGVLVAMLGVENTYATSALDGLVVAGELALGAGVALFVVSKVIRLDLGSLGPFFRK